MVGSRQPLGVFPRRGITDDLDDQVGGTFEFDKPVGLAPRRRHESHPARFDGVVGDGHDVRFDRQIARLGRDACFTGKEMDTATGCQRPQPGDQSGLQRAVREDVFRRPINLDMGRNPVDPAGRRKIIRKGPAAKRRERGEVAGDEALVINEHGGHGSISTGKLVGSTTAAV